MPLGYQLQIITQRGVQFDSGAQSVVAPGVMGYFGVHPHHAPMVAELGEGRLRVVGTNGKETTFHCDGGILEVTLDSVVVLADAVREVAPRTDGQASEA